VVEVHVSDYKTALNALKNFGRITVTRHNLIVFHSF